MISIILSGGAAKGGIEVGMLKAILEKYRYDQIEIITGTSVGSLNGALVAQQEFEKLIEIWRSIKSWKDIYRNWFLGYLQGFFMGGMVSFSPMEKIIEKNITEKIFDSPIDYYACDVNLYNHEITYTGNKEKKDISLLRKHILASASMVPNFRPIKIGEGLFTDGGAKEQIPVKQAVEKATDTDTFFILLTKKSKLTYSSSPIKNNLFNVIERPVDCLSDEIWESDIVVGKEKYWSDPNKFLVIEPTKNHVNNFKDAINPENIQKDIQHGYEVARKAMIEKGLW